MGARGYPALPTPILEARGSRRVAMRAGEVRPPVEKPSCPPTLKGEARKEWNRQVKLLEEMRCIAKCDRALLAAYCEAWEEFDALTAAIAELLAVDRLEGYKIAIRSGLVLAKNKAVERMIRLAGQFGFSPSARTRVHAVEEAANGGDEHKSKFFRAG